ncbi:DUF481 domain-containing protein [Exilibacterium tricleocarpae]|uniref:DUF481 domain-containing protein n=1 Tax=Exilibacterium tricleocarpae TaxID=2591008 RepID=A0A545TQI1_9GAMM|nr:DUF481 domain-containing protein [Exilibacterium tricleocarpae]TQV79480.1 DUF481 domain-containing protein [Exilibacterium tricleocarpae]
MKRPQPLSLRLALLVLVLVCIPFGSPVAVAGVLVLKNGDRLQGDLVKLEDEKITWKSDSFGTLSIAQDRVESLSTTTLVKMDGHSEPCAVVGARGEELQFSCADHSSGRVPLAALERLLPYEDHFNGAHTYRGKLSVAGTHTRGNRREEDWEVDSEVEFRRGDMRHMFGVEFESESTNDEAAEEEFDFTYGLSWFFQERWFLVNDLGLGMDESKNIDERYAFGSGLGYQFWETDRKTLSLESGVSYLKELFNRSPGDSEGFERESSRVTWRWATNFRYKLPLSASLVHKNELFYSFEDSGDWEFDSDTGLNVPLGAGLFSEFKVEYDYDNMPQQDERKSDTKLSVGVGYVW